MIKRRKSRFSKCHAAWVALAALVLHALIPAGYMIDTSARDGLRVEMCSANAEVSAWIDTTSGAVDLDGEPLHEENPNGTRHIPCVFAGIDLASTGPATGIIDISPEAQIDTLILPEAFGWIDRTGALPLPARGPPQPI